MVFLIDLPKWETAEQREAQEMTPFAEDLLYFLRAQGLDEKLVSSLKNYDFSETSRYGFVHTMWVLPLSAFEYLSFADWKPLAVRDLIPRKMPGKGQVSFGFQWWVRLRLLRLTLSRILWTWPGSCCPWSGNFRSH